MDWNARIHFAAIGLLLLASSAHAARTSISGNVTDGSGVPIDAKVHIDSSDGKKKYTVNSKGGFSYFGLPANLYHIWAETKDGKRSNDVQLDTGINANIRLDLIVPDAVAPRDAGYQAPIVSGCVTTRDIRARGGSTYVLQGTALQQNVPHLEATIINECPCVTSVTVTLGYYSESGVQFATQVEAATIAPGSTFALVHVLDCAKYGTCDPVQWKTKMRVIQVQAFKQ